MPRLANAQAYRKANVATLHRLAKEVVEAEVARSSLFDFDAQEGLPKFELDELLLGRVIGRGGFCAVKEIIMINLINVNDADDDEAPTGSRRYAGQLLLRGSSLGRSPSLRDRSMSSSELSTREHLARRVWAKKNVKYVVKMVEPELLHSDRVTYLKGIIDLQLEIKYLASLNHPHVMKVRGCSVDEKNTFFIMEQLTEILPKRLNAWMHLKRASRGVTGVLTGGRRRGHALITERFLVALDIAEALDFLHSRGIIYRDLKPDNIGFDGEGVLKIFDMGLAKELNENDRDESGLYRNMTGFTGAIRYMAPEVGLQKPYNLKADVYSWSMLMWYIMSLEPPFGMYTPRMFVDRVFTRGYRPAIKIKWPTIVGDLLRICWSEDIVERPSFAQVVDTLKDQVHEIDPRVAAALWGTNTST